MFAEVSELVAEHPCLPNPVSERSEAIVGGKRQRIDCHKRLATDDCHQRRPQLPFTGLVPVVAQWGRTAQDVGPHQLHAGPPTQSDRVHLSQSGAPLPTWYCLIHIMRDITWTILTF